MDDSRQLAPYFIQIPLSLQELYPTDDLQMSGGLGRLPIFPDDVLPTLALPYAFGPNHPRLNRCDDDGSLWVTVKHPDPLPVSGGGGGGGGGPYPVVSTQADQGHNLTSATVRVYTIPTPAVIYGVRATAAVAVTPNWSQDFVRFLVYAIGASSGLTFLHLASGYIRQGDAVLSLAIDSVLPGGWDCSALFAGEGNVGLNVHAFGADVNWQVEMLYH